MVESVYTNTYMKVPEPGLNCFLFQVKKKQF